MIAINKIGKKRIAALFDLDGVVFDTETQYSDFWGVIGRETHPEIQNFDRVIKGQTLVQIYERWFPDNEPLRTQITDRLQEFERTMTFEYINGAQSFISQLRKEGIQTAIVTSSNNEKMKHVYAAHPEIETLFDKVLTAEYFTYSKPHPECYLIGAKELNAEVKNCIVFEDSFHGLEAGRRAGMIVVGLATTNPADAISGLSDCVIDNFSSFHPEKIFRLLG